MPSNMAARIVDGLALRDRLAAIDPVVLQERGTRGVDLHFEFHSQFTGVLYHHPMGARQPRRAEVLIVALCPSNRLNCAVDELNFCAVSSCEVAPARPLAGLENGHLVAKLLHLVRCNQTADATTENGHTYVFANTRRRLDLRHLFALHGK